MQAGRAVPAGGAHVRSLGTAAPSRCGLHQPAHPAHRPRKSAGSAGPPPLVNAQSLLERNPIAHFAQHGVGLSDGAMFGAAKGSHVRLNFGGPRSTLTEAIRRMKAALAAR